MPNLLVGTTGGLFRLRTDTPNPRAQRIGFPEREVTALSGSERDVWALLGDGSLHRRVEDSWSAVARVGRWKGSCLLAAAGTVWVGTSEAHLLRLEGAELEPVQGFDGVAGRDRWYTPWGGAPDTRSLSASGADVIYANVHVGGILRSGDGDTWESTIDIHSDVHQVLADTGRTGLVLAATARGLAISADGGESWDFRTQGLHATYCRAVALVGSSVLVSVSEGPGGAHSALYRTSPAPGAALERSRAGLPEWFNGNIDTGWLIADETAAFGSPDGEIFLSHDQAGTWQRVATDLPAIRCIAFDHTDHMGASSAR